MVMTYWTGDNRPSEEWKRQQRKRITWRDVQRAAKGSGYFVAYNYDLEEPLERLADDARVLCCNNGWPQATTPQRAMALINQTKD